MYSALLGEQEDCCGRWQETRNGGRKTVWPIGGEHPLSTRGLVRGRNIIIMIIIMIWVQDLSTRSEDAYSCISGEREKERGREWERGSERGREKEQSEKQQGVDREIQGGRKQGQ